MNKLSLVFVAGLAFATFGCKKKGGGADCDKAINHSMELSKADMAKMPGMDDATMQKMKDIGLQHCKDDKWPDDVLKCMVDAKTEAEGQTCYGKLSQDQQSKMNKAVMDMAPTGNTGSAPAAAPTGSDMGSAGSAMGAAGSDTGSAAAGSDTGSAGSAAK